MRKYLLLAAFYTLTLATATAQSTEITDAYVQDQVAKGKIYTFVELVPGAHEIKNEAEKNRLIATHVKYIFQLKADKKLATAGPVMNDKHLHGIYIFNTPQQEEVQKLLDADPAISKGHFSYRMYTWFSIPGDQLGQQ